MVGFWRVSPSLGSESLAPSKLGILVFSLDLSKDVFSLIGAPRVVAIAIKFSDIVFKKPFLSVPKGSFFFCSSRTSCGFLRSVLSRLSSGLKPNLPISDLDLILKLASFFLSILPFLSIRPRDLYLSWLKNVNWFSSNLDKSFSFLLIIFCCSAILVFNNSLLPSVILEKVPNCANTSE